MSELDIFAAAFEIDDPEQRARYLDQACGDDLKRRQRIERLLIQAEQNDSFLEPDTSHRNFTGSADGERLAAGTAIGPFRIGEKLGEGGMGVVYVATQDHPVKRVVALKVIKPGMDSRQVLARFDAERQVLALMDHPNIAKVLDAGTTEQGLPYFVMELVDGAPITRYCDEHQLSLHDRLLLFIEVCKGVQHAHQKGIIHRDLKPSNILVTQYDGLPVPKVIDFGVSKAIESTLDENSMQTQLGQIVGTLEYMSPEQAQQEHPDIDTRTDIYALGVILYELLTGDTPFDKRRLRSAALDELIRILSEEEPPKPSSKVRTHPGVEGVAKSRGTEPARLSTLVRGELDWITMKALAKERERRYASAIALALDLQNYLENGPISACPPTTAYRLRKFWRRNRIALMMTLLVASLLVSGTIVSGRQAFRASRAEQHATRQQQLVSETNRELESKIAELDAAQAMSNEALLKLESAQQKSNQNFAFALDGLEQFLSDFATSSLAQIPGYESEKQRLLSAAVARYEELTDANPDRSDLKRSYAQVLFQLGEVSELLHDLRTAEACFDKCIELREQLLLDIQREEDQASLQSGLLYTYLGLARVKSGRSPNEAESLFLKSIELADSLNKEVDEKGGKGDLAVTRNIFGIFLAENGRPDEAMDQFVLAHSWAGERLRGSILHHMALIERERENLTEALRLVDEAIACPNQPADWARNHWSLKAKLHVSLGQFDQAGGPCSNAIGLAQGVAGVERRTALGRGSAVDPNGWFATQSNADVLCELLILRAKIHTVHEEQEDAIEALEQARWILHLASGGQLLEKYEIERSREIEQGLADAYQQVGIELLAVRHRNRAQQLEEDIKLIAEARRGYSWQVGNLKSDNLEAVAIGQEGEVFVAGRMGSGADLKAGTQFQGLPSYSGPFVCKYGSDESVEWILPIGVPANGWVESMVIDGSGNLIAVGHLYRRVEHELLRFGALELQPPDGRWSDIAFVTKVDPQGKVLWARWAGVGKTPKVVEDVHVAAGVNDQVIVGGAFLADSIIGDRDRHLLLSHDGEMSSERRGYVACFDANGNVEWVESMHGAASAINSVACDREGNIFVGGACRPIKSATLGEVSLGESVRFDEWPQADLSAAFLLCLNSQGKVQWVRPQISAGGNLCFDVVVGNDQKVYMTTLITGETDLDGASIHPARADWELDGSGQDVNLSCWNADGDLLWHRLLHREGRRIETRGMSARDPEGVFFTGFVNAGLISYDNQPLPRYPRSGTHGFLMEISGNGQLVDHWFFTARSGSDVRPRGLGVNSKHQLVVAGWFNGKVRMPTGEVFVSQGETEGFLSIIEAWTSDGQE